MSNRKKAKNRPFLTRRALERESLPPADIEGQLHEVLGSDSDAEKEVLTTVPAKAEGVVIGEAVIYTDGSVDIKIDPDAPPDAVAKVKALEEEMRFMGLKED